MSWNEGLKPSHLKATAYLDSPLRVLAVSKPIKVEVFIETLRD